MSKHRPRPASQLRLILASASPRRRQLLRAAGVAFRVKASRYIEGRPHGRPEDFARAAAAAKAAEVAGRSKGPAWILAADTLVVCGRKIFGKPRHRQEAAAMLRALSGRWHWVMTGVALQQVPGGKKISWVEKTAVRLRRLDARELRSYLDSRAWRDKAGGYGIQERAGAFVLAVRGCYFNVVGLPLGRVCAHLRALRLL